MNDKIWQWVGDYCSGSLDENEERELRAWLDESEENKRYFMESVKISYECRVARLSVVNKEDSLKRILARARARKRKRLWIGCSVAASVLFLFVLSFTLHHSLQESREPVPVLAKLSPGETKATLELADGVQVDLTRDNLQEVISRYGITVMKDEENGLRYDCLEEKEEKPVFHTISVPVGGEYHLTLPDGTMVWLNSASQMTFPTRFTGGTREVIIEGEVYFEVHHDQSLPFIVRAGDTRVRVLGTKFCVSAYPENPAVMTTLVEGSVNVASGGNDVVLKPGSQALVDRQTKAITQREVELSLYTAWVKGIFEYENMKLEDIMEQLARWYNVKFDFSARECKERRFTGMVRKYADLNDVLATIEKTTNVKFIIHERNITITSVTR